MIILTLIFVALTALYFYSTRNYNYWKNKGVKHDKPLPLVGNNLSNYLLMKSATQVAVDLYWKYPDEKVVGFYRASQLELLIRDPAIIKQVLTSDFHFFYPRGLNPHKTVIEPLMQNLFFADGDLWRLLRQRMTPAFTSGKLKAMFPLICERAEKLQQVVAAATRSGESKALDARDIMARYTTDFIGTVGFGLDANSLADENSAFRKLGYKIFNLSIPNVIVAILKELFPEMCKHVHVMFRIEKELIDLVNEILRQRNYEPSGRNDFIDLLLECKKKGVIVGKSIENVKPDGTPEEATLEMTDLLIAAQVFVFFAAGFETSSSATSYTLHQLAFNRDKQKKVQEEVVRVLAKYNNKLCYDAVKEMTYLEWAFKESMRMFPSLGFLIRKSARTYTFKDLNLTIDPNVGIMIPIQAIQNDTQYFENPEVFRPERFHPDEFKDTKNKFVYLPFGEGPRACIGERLGLMQSLAGLAAVLSKYSVEPAKETIRYPKVNPKSSIVQTIYGGERLGLMQSLAGLAAVLSKYSVEPAKETIRYPKVNPKSSIVQTIYGGLPLIFKERTDSSK